MNTTSILRSIGCSLFLLGAAPMFAQFSVCFPDDLANRSVSMSFHGKYYEASANGNGMYTLQLPDKLDRGYAVISGPSTATRIKRRRSSGSAKTNIASRDTTRPSMNISTTGLHTGFRSTTLPATRPSSANGPYSMKPYSNTWKSNSCHSLSPTTSASGSIMRYATRYWRIPSTTPWQARSKTMPPRRYTTRPWTRP